LAQLQDSVGILCLNNILPSKVVDGSSMLEMYADLLQF
jgi:hypothetical protein